MVKKSSKGKMIARAAALTALLQTGCLLMPSGNEVRHEEKKPGLTLTNMEPEEKKDLKDFFVDYSLRSPTAKRTLKDLAKLGTTIEFFEKDVDENRIFDAGLSDENVLSLNRLMAEKEVPFDDTFFHESEHVLHLNAAHRHGINGASFRSLDDVYIYGTIMEALAYHKAALCCAEYEYGPERFAEAQEYAKQVFLDRMSANNKAFEERLSYERAALARASFETNVLPNQVYFKGEPDWNEVITIMSRGEITEVPVLPQPTPTFLHLCVLQGLEKNPDATKPSDFDLSCTLAHQSSLWQDESDIKQMVAGLLAETYIACEKTGTPLSQDTQYSFLYLMGWPTSAQSEMIDAEEKTFDEVRADNLAQIPLKELFDGAQALIESPDVQAYNTYETQNYGKMLHIEKQIFCPEQVLPVRHKQSTR